MNHNKMKKIFLYGSMLLFINLLLQSCDNNSTYSVTANIDGLPWKSDGYVQANEADSFLIINAFSDDQTFIALEFKQYETPGTYSLDSSSNAFGFGTYFGSSSTLTHYTSANRPGIFTITSFSASDKKIKGNFELTAFTSTHDSIRVSDGSFDVNFQN